MSKLNPTPEQIDIIDFVCIDSRNLLVRALAGSAKTTTLQMAGNAIASQPGRKLAIAFNVSTKDALQRALGTAFDVKTLNGVGHSAWARLLGSKKINLNKRKTYTLSDKMNIHEAYKPLVRKLFNAARTHGLLPNATYHTSVKRFLPDAVESWQFLAEFAQIEEATLDPTWAANHDQIIDLTKAMLKESISLAYSGEIDFLDQIFMPTCFLGSFEKYPLVFVDEAQDLSKINHQMLKSVVGRRLVAVGDANQAIYGFRGADYSSMDSLAEMFKMETKSLTICFRCASSIITEAQTYVPEIQPYYMAKTGNVENLQGQSWTIKDIPDNSAILCRNNAPLFALFFAFLRKKQPVRFVGSQIAERVISIIQRIDGEQNLPRKEIITAFEEHIEALPEDKRDFIIDVQEIVSLTPGKDTKEILSSIALVLRADTGNIYLSTGHRAKGLEWNTVFLLDWWRVPSKYARTDEQKQQERNIAYVMLTRAKENLIYLDLSDLTHE